MPEGFQLGDPPLILDIESTAEFAGPIEICIDYSDLKFKGNPNSIRLMHYEGGEWVDITVSHNTQADVICGITNSLSPFGLVTPFSETDDLASYISELDTNAETIDEWLAMLEEVDELLNDENSKNDKAARNILNAIINSASGKSGNEISEEDAEAIITLTNELLSHFFGE